MSEKIYVIGHKSPDTDTVVSAIVGADFLNKRDGTEVHIPVVTGDLNAETEFVRSQFGFNVPDKVTTANGEKYFLVDHNEESQIVDGEKHIIGFIDHHKIGFQSANPLDIMVKPWGCTCTILYNLYKKEGIDIPEDLKGPMLSAILSDTVILKSPTTTKKDIEVVEILAKDVGIDFKELGMNMFKAKGDVASKSAIEIIKVDFKDFDINGKKVGIGQIETPDLNELDTKIDDLRESLTKLKTDEGYHTVVLMMTDIMEEGSKLMVASDGIDTLAEMFKTTFTNQVSDFIPGMMSRKKQVAPVLTNNL